MQPIVTLTERKAAEASCRRDAVAALVPVLAEYARAQGGPVRVAAAVRHVTGAIALFAWRPDIQHPMDRYRFGMGFMHAMQSGQT